MPLPILPSLLGAAGQYFLPDEENVTGWLQRKCARARVCIGRAKWVGADFTVNHKLKRPRPGDPHCRRTPRCCGWEESDAAVVEDCPGIAVIVLTFGMSVVHMAGVQVQRIVFNPDRHDRLVNQAELGDAVHASLPEQMLRRLEELPPHEMAASPFPPMRCPGMWTGW